MKIKWVLLALTGISFLLRWIQASTAYVPAHDDELHLINEAFNMMVTGNFHTVAFPYGDVCKFFYLILDCIYYLYGLLQGHFNDISSVTLTEVFYTLNRLTNGLTGSLAIPVGYLIGKKLFSKNAGLIMAILIFANPLLFKYSLLAKPDDTAFLFHLLSIYFALDIGSNKPRLSKRGYVLSALFIAFSMGAKIHNVVAVFFPLFMHLFSQRDNLFKKIFNLNLCLFFSIIISVYFVLTPTALLDFNWFWFHWLTIFFPDTLHIEGQQAAYDYNMIRLFVYMQRMINDRFLFSFFYLGIFGLIGSRQKTATLFTGCTLIIFFWFFIFHSELHIDPHELFPLLPMLLIFIMSGIVFLGNRFSFFIQKVPNSFFTVTLTCFLAFFPFTRSIVNFEKDGNFIGAGYKESFISYLFGIYEGPPSTILITNPPFSEKERLSFSKLSTKKGPLFIDPSFEDMTIFNREWSSFGAAQLTEQKARTGKKSLLLQGKESEVIKIIPRKLRAQIESLNLWVHPACSSDLLRSSLSLNLLAVKDVGHEKRKIHDNLYNLFVKGERNWREISIPIPQELKLDSWNSIHLPLRKNLEQGGISWNNIDYYILKIKLTSSFQTLTCYIDDVGIK